MNFYVVQFLRRPLLPKEPSHGAGKPNRTRRPKPSEAKAKAAGKSKAKAKAKAKALVPGEEAEAEGDSAPRAAKRAKNWAIPFGDPFFGCVC